jgi:LCP family protein required for cell wall assembly
MSERYGAGALPPLPAHLDPRGRHRHRRSGPSTAIRILLSLMAVVSVLTFCAAAYAWWQFKDLNNGLQRGNFNPRALGTTHHDIDGKSQNLLVVGYDSRQGLSRQVIKQLHVGSDVSSSTDTMMIIHVPANGQKATLISLPRDAYVQIPGHGMNKLNAAWSEGYYSLGSSATDAQRKVAGAQLLTETISNLTGLTIDHFVLVSFAGFVSISDAVGGVQVNLCNAVDDQRYSGLVLSAGRHTLKGPQALQFVRQRHGLPNGDLDRTARQRYFLAQAFRKVASAGTLVDPGRLSSLVSAVDQSIWVDSSLDIKSLALQMASLDPNNIVGKAIPFVRYANVDVGSVEIVDPAAVQRFVANMINPPAAKPATSHASSATHAAGSTTGTARAKPRKKSACIN